MLNNPFAQLRYPAQLIAKAQTKIEKLDNDNIVVIKYLTGENDSIVELSRETVGRDKLQAELDVLDAEIAQYSNADWIASQVAKISDKKAPIQEKILLLTN